MIRNEDVKRVLLGTPENHRHLRISVMLEKECIIFSEATIANILRGFVTIKTHPRIDAIELMGTRLHLKGRRAGYAEHQLLETGKAPEEVKKELSSLISQSDQ